MQDSRGLCLFRFYGHCDHTMNMHVELLTILCRSIIHTFQKVNACVDILTKKVASTSVPLVMLELCPDDVLPCVIAYALERVLYACNSCVFFSSLIKRNIYNIFMHQRSIEVCNIKISPSMTMLKKHYILTKKCGKYKNLTSYNIFLYFKLNFKRI